MAGFAGGADGGDRNARTGFTDAHGVVHAGVVGEELGGAERAGIGQQDGEALAGGGVAVAIAFAERVRVGRYGEPVGDLVIGERGRGGVDGDVDREAEIAVGGDDAGAGDGGAVEREGQRERSRIRRARDCSGGRWAS